MHSLRPTTTGERNALHRGNTQLDICAYAGNLLPCITVTNWRFAGRIQPETNCNQASEIIF
jgi:hypothetical protein